MANETGADTGPKAASPAIAWAKLPRRVLAGFLAADLLIVLAYAAVVLAKLRWNSPLFMLFDVNQEANVPSWYSSIQLLLVGLALLALASPLLSRHEGLNKLRSFWLVMGIGFVYLSADEGGVIHERISEMMVSGSKPGSSSGLVSLLHAVGFKGTFRGGGVWILLYAAIAVILAVVLMPSILRVLRTWPRESMLFLAGIGLMFAGGIVVEGVSNLLRLREVAHLIEVGAEEAIEMLGGTVALYGGISVLAAAAAALSSGAALPPAEESPEETRQAEAG